MSLRDEAKKHKARRVEYISPDGGKEFVFLTNNFRLKAETIACLLMSVFRARNGIRKMSFSNMLFVVRRVLMEYVWLNMALLEPERTLTRMLSRQNRAQAPPTLFD